MRLEKLQAGFSTADTSYPELVSFEGQLSVRFKSSDGHPVRVEFKGVPAFSWQENNGVLLPEEPWDGPCELFESKLLAAHPPGLTMNSSAGPLRHIRFHFNECGRLDVLCVTFSAPA